MKLQGSFKNFERAQTIPLVVVVLVVLIAFSVLMVDGGAVMLNRRTAQAAADAGAMAGARELCYSSGADPLVVAENYAISNGATTANAQISNGVITVDASVVNDSFFSKIYGVDELRGDAEADAGCFGPTGNFLLPIGWSCRPSLTDTAPFDPGLDCKAMTLDWSNLLEPLVEGDIPSITIPGNAGNFEMDGNNIVEIFTRKPPKQIYLVMDKISTNEESYCKEDLDPSDPEYDAALSCDLDGDGKHDIEGAGNRGWLDLDNGGGGASDMRNWIINGLDFPISPHTWLSGQSGTVSSVYQAIEDYRVGDVVLIPVFNAICDDNDPTGNTACMNAAHAYPLPPEPASGDIDNAGQKPKYHITTFAPFYISCVHIHQSDSCPGFDLAVEMNPDPKKPKKSLIPDNMPSVEGFFLTNVELSLDTDDHCDVNLGNCMVSIIR